MKELKYENLGYEINRLRVEEPDHRSVECPQEAHDVLVAVPAYNEDRFIGSVVLKIRQAGYTPMVIDDGSLDATAEVARLAGAIVVQHEKNQGKGAAVSTAFAEARARKAFILVLIDGDGQHQPAEIATLVAAILEQGADMVVGSRFLKTHSEIPSYRIVGQYALTAATNLSSGMNVSDSQSGFRAFSRQAIEVMRFGSGGFSVESEMQFLAGNNKLKILEAPISVYYDKNERLKRNPVRQGFEVLNGIIQLIAQQRPLFFFSLPGAVMIVAGLILGLDVVDIYTKTHLLAVGYAMITVMLVITGNLSLFVGIMLNSIARLLERLEGRLR